MFPLKVCLGVGRPFSHEGFHSIYVNSVSWIHSPCGLLKLNLDGSFIKKLGKGGWGVVNRDSAGQVLCHLSGSIQCQDSNAAKVYAMLMGCHGSLIVLRQSLKVILFLLLNGDYVR